MIDAPITDPAHKSRFSCSLSLVIPTYKEEQRLPQTVREIIQYLVLRFEKFEVIIVDDNSPDKTGQIVNDFSKQYPQVRLIIQPDRIGKGAAVRRGCMEACCDFVLFMDADHATPIAEVERFIPHLAGRVDGVVAGVRNCQENESRNRRIVSLICQLLAHICVFQKTVIDSQCGFKLFTASTAARLFPHARVDGGMIDVELFYLMHKMSIPCHYVPVTWRNKEGSRINFIACAMRDPIDMLRIRLRGLVHLYDKPIASKFQPWNTRT
jgi:dolichyl-phosphate beta-glucosyltransferase